MVYVIGMIFSKAKEDERFIYNYCIILLHTIAINYVSCAEDYSFTSHIKAFTNSNNDGISYGLFQFLVEAEYSTTIEEQHIPYIRFGARLGGIDARFFTGGMACVALFDAFIPDKATVDLKSLSRACFGCEYRFQVPYSEMDGAYAAAAFFYITQEKLK